VRPEEPSRAERSPRLGAWLDRWLVASLLVVVASVQLGLTSCAGLSPWKGGGFGMFAVIDAPATRVLSAEGFDAQGRRYRVDPWSALSKGDTRELQSFPSGEALSQLGAKLADSEFVVASNRVVAALERLKAENPTFQVEMQGLADGGQLLYRVRRADDPEVAGRTAVRFARVELQMWRLRFDHPNRRLWCEPVLGPVVAESGAR
jgi:hypothetical protein